eukprot:CAMPEP_0183291044 /NCGR_PEP_ID=MMETSP0160_2-20130417/597_1 /TAXON_ID=2839 ORGANISM="Odontella Sinensis, Strain Grunow 1884" /NCGR_SAMPLE_ID=MMETSP0160_2 /ASSEMBLY_ACC=CAM_ASM_000250 /LENGTH=323 /DNA_ID=CAMNT_0025451791 /DNA_START=92 /DNA_END=1063 /DNA_ORIENTATION=+
MPFLRPAALAALLALAASAPAASAFSVSTPRSFAPLARSAPSAAAVVPLRMSDEVDENWPSDSSDDSHLYEEEEGGSSSSSAATIDVSPEPLTASETAVSSVLDAIPDGSLPGAVDASTRAKINEALLKLEALNPTESPAQSPLLNGVWSLRYAAGYSDEWALPSPTRQLALFLYSGGYSPGLFALGLARKLPVPLVELGDLEITISRSQPRVHATISAKLFGGSESEVSVDSHLTVDSDVRLTETYESASVLGQTVDIPEQVQYSRDMYVTYVDEDILVVRDASGVPEVLVRKEKVFRETWGTEPGEVEDLSAPGEEVPATD